MFKYIREILIEKWTKNIFIDENNYSPAIADTRGKLRQTIGIFTTPIFGALRRFVVWGDQNYGSCDISLAVAARGLEANTGINDNFNAEEEE